MRQVLMLLCFNFCAILSIGQITVGSNSIPDVGDVLKYSTFVEFDDSLSFKVQGDNRTWVYNDIVTIGVEEEVYASIVGSNLEADFPTANMAFDFGGFEVAVEKTDNELAVVGFGEVGFGGFGTEGNTYLNEKFRIKSTPFNYGDVINDMLEVNVTISSDLIPGLDSLELPLPGATLDSIRVITQIFKTETATAWGSLTLNGEDYDVLKVEQIDSTGSIFEVGLNVFGTIVWFDPSEFLGGTGGGDFPGFGGLPGAGLSTVTHKFLTADSKTSIIEFEENRTLDSLGVISVVVNGRIGAGVDMVNDLVETTLDSHLKIYPNPTQDYFVINGALNNNDDYELSVYDNLGRLLFTDKAYLLGNKVSLVNAKAGIMHIVLTNKDGVSIFNGSIHKE